MTTRLHVPRFFPARNFSAVGQKRFGKLHSHGFTLLELLVVIVIIGMLAAYVGPKYFAQLSKSEVTVARSQMESISKALDTFRLDVGRYPSSDEGFTALMVQPERASGWNGPYLKKAVPNDPWGNAYLYLPTQDGTDFQIVSMGKDGKKGGTGDASDLSK